MVRGSQEMYVCELINLPLAQSMDRLWKDGFLVAVQKPDDTDSPPVYRDNAGIAFDGANMAGRMLARLEAEGDRIRGITFYDTNTVTGRAVQIPPDRIFVR